jgi:hypothetical protein
MFKSAIAMTLVWSTVGVLAQEFNWFRGNSTLKIVKGSNAGPCALVSCFTIAAYLSSSGDILTTYSYALKDEQSYTQSSFLQINSPIANETNKFDLIFLTDNLESINGEL